MIEYTQIPLKDLEIGSWYIGRGIGGNVGYWDGDSFATVCIYQKSYEEFQNIWAIREGRKSKPFTEEMKKGREVIKHERYYSHKDHERCYSHKDHRTAIKDREEVDDSFWTLGTFQPFLKINLGETINRYDPYREWGEKLKIE